jgi:hypothetical protein
MSKGQRNIGFEKALGDSSRRVVSGHQGTLKKRAAVCRHDCNKSVGTDFTNPGPRGDTLAAETYTATGGRY